MAAIFGAKIEIPGQMMKTTALAALSLALLVSGASGQDSGKAEMFAGYSLMRSGTLDGLGVYEFTGFDVDGTYYFLHKGGLAAGLTAEISYYRKDVSSRFPGGALREYGLMFGPRCKVRIGRVEPFIHGLAGYTNDFANGPGLANTSGNEFSMKAGGGLDVPVSKHFAVRAGELNFYFYTGWVPPFGGPNWAHIKNFTYSTGIVVKF